MSNNKLTSTGRIDYGHYTGQLELPNLIEAQIKSYDWFIKEGIKQAFLSVSPFENAQKTVKIEYLDHRLEEPIFDHLESKIRSVSYESKLVVRFRFHADNGIMLDDDVFFGAIPRMTESGTFIINGNEKCIISQILRAPGSYVVDTKEIEKKTGSPIYMNEILPYKGDHIQIKNSYNLLYVNLKRISRKINICQFLYALGATSTKEIIDLLGNNELLEKSIESFREDYPGCDSKEKNKDYRINIDCCKGIHQIIKNDLPDVEEAGIKDLKHMYFEAQSWELGEVGRYTFKRRLNIYDRLINQVIAQDIEDKETGEIYPKGTLITREIAESLKEHKALDKTYSPFKDHAFMDLYDTHNEVVLVKVYKNYGEDDEKVCNIVGIDPRLTVEDANHLTFSDLFASISAFLNTIDGLSKPDDIDNLKNRRIRSVGEILLKEYYRPGLSALRKNVNQKISQALPEKFNISDFMNTKTVESKLQEFFLTSEFGQYMDQTNPLSELTNKRRISVTGKGGISRESAKDEIRDVHYTYYGRICPVETPEGQSVGLMNSLASYAKIDEYGFIITPYRKVVHKDGKNIITEENEYFAADKESLYTIAECSVNTDENNVITDKLVQARRDGENILVTPDEIDYIGVSPKQVVGVAASCIPFLENDDATRALMGSNMQRQAVPLLRPEAPFVGTGVENRVAKDSGLSVIAKEDGKVIYVDSTKISVETGEKDITGKQKIHEYNLRKYERSNKGTCINQTSIVKIGDKIKKGQIIADGPSMNNGDLALGQNVTIAFMTWNGYNYEDAVIMSERLVKDDTYTSIHLEHHEINLTTTVNGDETLSVPTKNITDTNRKHLDGNGIIIIGSEVKDDDVLVGKLTPTNHGVENPNDKLINAINNTKGNEPKEAPLRVPHGGAGIVVDVKRFMTRNLLAGVEGTVIDINQYEYVRIKDKKGNIKDLPLDHLCATCKIGEKLKADSKIAGGDKLQSGVNETIRVFIAQKRKITVGDKMSGRHGNKGVISRILPVEDMPYLPDGTPVDIMLNPLGVPSRMNIGQVLEIHLGLACKKLGLKIATPVFDGISDKEIMRLMDEAKIAKDGKTILYDGRTGERFDERISVGVMYMIKLHHMVDDKLHARSNGPVDSTFNQPLGGKAQKGGQRLGEMEVWALEAYGAANTLQEMLTIKSDDHVGSIATYDNIIKGVDLPPSGIPEAFRVLVKFLQGLCININLYDKDDKVIDLSNLAEEITKQERRSLYSLRNANSDPIWDKISSFDEDDNEIDFNIDPNKDND